MEGVLNLAGGLAVLVGVVVLVAVLAGRGAAERRRVMAAYAAARGWRYEREQPLLVGRFTGPPFGTGQARQALNVLYGVHDGRDLVVFDYAFTTVGPDKKKQRHVFSVVAVRTGVHMPPLRVDPEGWLDRVVGHFTGDIDLESEEFNRAFSVACPDRRFASDVLHPRMMELLLRHRELGWRFERDSVLVVAAGRRTPAQLDAVVAVLDAILDQVPEFVWLRGLG